MENKLPTEEEMAENAVAMLDEHTKWCKENDSDVTTILKQYISFLEYASTRSSASPFALIAKKQILDMAVFGFTFGFHIGRKFQSVPEAFLKIRIPWYKKILSRK